MLSILAIYVYSIFLHPDLRYIGMLTMLTIITWSLCPHPAVSSPYATTIAMLTNLRRGGSTSPSNWHGSITTYVIICAVSKIGKSCSYTYHISTFQVLCQPDASLVTKLLAPPTISPMFSSQLQMRLCMQRGNSKPISLSLLPPPSTFSHSTTPPPATKASNQ